MEWQLDVANAELLLRSAVIPSSERIISAIKKVNPTRLCLPDPEKKEGYRLKSQLQNLLLEHYGEAFQLVPHPCSPNVVLIKHLFLPSVDACHADLGALSAPALENVSVPGEEVSRKPATEKRRQKMPAGSALSPRDSLRRAQQCLEEYDYITAEQEVAGIRAINPDDVTALCSAIMLLHQHVGAYQTAIDTLLAQPPHVLKDKRLRELLALAYHSNAMPAEAGAVFDSLHPSELGKEALVAYARLALRDGNARFARELLRLAETKDGLIAEFDELRREVEQLLARKAEPVLQQAESAFSQGEWDQAVTLSRQALEEAKNLPKARRIIALVEAMKEQGELITLWQAFESSSNGKERQRLLGRLLERDKRSRARINTLLQVEKEKERHEFIEQRLRTLRQALRDERWPECYDEVMWLSRQEDAVREYHDAIALSPLFEVLYRNKQLERISRHDAQEAWITYIEAKKLFDAGRDREALPMLQKVRPVFRAVPCFNSMYHRVVAAQQAAATVEADRLLTDVRGGALSYQESLAHCNAARAAIDILPGESRAAYAAAIDDLLEQLKPSKDTEVLLEEYRQARMTGQTARASSLREMVTEPSSLAAVDAEVDALMRIEVEPVPLVYSPDMEVDVAREHPGLQRVGSTDRHVFLGESETSVILIDFVEMTAWRLQSENFSGLGLIDDIADQHLFLFHERGTNRYWRAIMKGRESRFTALIDFTQPLCLPEYTQVARAFLSSCKETEYFYVLKDPVKEKILCLGRMTLGLGRNSGPECNLRMEEIQGITRASSAPDHFAVGTKTAMWLTSRNLRMAPKFHLPWHVFGIDQRNRLIYLVHGPRLKACDYKWDLIQDYTHSICLGMSYGHSVRGICPETGTVLMTYKTGRGVFYNLETNEFSNQFSLSTFICTDVPSTWYYMEYSEETSSMRVKNITHEVSHLMKWEEIISMDNYQKIPDEALLDPLRRMLAGEDVVGLQNEN
ncbi:hypothetical protein M1B72_18040 [Geomonas paludis]|uniref:Uncharacterized protein n=2 Tax=Geomonas paludis TaxID=2740185 RepID=A0ABY4LC35_9BACT|nr:hypothetical protein [Geomonas paludis]UPU35324.1 hypothetical protein M1B72_18040 [Geomonas paludis]